jgi:hypothetical protein
VVVGQDPGGLGDEARFEMVDVTCVLSARRGWQPDGLVQGQSQACAGRLPGQGECRRDLVDGELAHLLGKRSGWRGRSPVGGAAPGQLGYRGQQFGVAP